MAPPLASAGELARAIDQGNIDALRAQVHDGRPDAERGREGKTALMVAARAGELALVADLIAAGADVNTSSNNGGTAMMFAAYSGNAQVVLALLAAGAAVDEAGGFEWTPLSVAAVKGRTTVAKLLLERGADPNHRDVYAWTPLMRAIDNGHHAVARLLAQHPEAQLDAVDELGWSALHHCARHGNTGLATLLMQAGASARILNTDQRDAAAVARLGGHARLAEALEQHAQSEAATGGEGRFVPSDR